jgi:hypothetical protein
MPTEMLRQALLALAAPPDEQVARFPAFVAVADELALDFDDALAVLTSPDAAWTGGAGQRAALDAVDSLLEDMSRRHDETLWTVEALQERPEWRRVRRLAAAALAAFG